MRIQNNVSAAIAMRHLTINRSALMKSLEKLSSGYAVNRAGDDAAGLAISEKMRSQITGLDRALRNSKEGSNLIQTGEGALAEIHDMLNRATLLAEQSANGTYDNELDRQVLQRELDQLCADIDRIAESANFNGIKLFQNKGLEYEGKSSYAGIPDKATERAAAAENARSATGPAVSRTLDDLLEGQEKGELNIVYIEQVNRMVEADPSPYGGSTLGNDKDIIITNPDGSTSTKKLSEILKTEIVPNIVKQVLDKYSAFSYLTGSTIGIGLRLEPSMYGEASVAINLYEEPDTKYLDYALSVNMSSIPDHATRDDLTYLESVICHEMIHAFMDEATTAGMVGFDPVSGEFDQKFEFPGWFAEGMAQTASGSGNWVLINSGSGLRIDKDSDANTIKVEIQSHPLNSDAGGSVYGTGYLACMYLGWAIAGGGNAPVTAQKISKGLNSLLSEVIGGSSLDAAINKLTGGKYTSTSDFQTKFTAADDTAITDFVHNLLVARGDGRGGLISGDLTATDLVPNDVDTSGTKLFELYTNDRTVENKYPDDYVVLTGGSVSTNSVAPPDFPSQGQPKPPVNPDDPKPDDPPPYKPKPDDPTTPEKEGGGIILQIGAEYGETLEVPQFYLSLEALGMRNLDISTQSNAGEAMSVIKDAINRVSSIRGTYGALYNRLEHNQNQLQYMTENITDAESRIRDVDVAEEMMRYTKSNILIQSAQVMLAQANQIPQAVLQMLS